MAVMGMMQMTFHEVIDVIAVGDGLVSAAWPVNMPLLMSSAIMTRRAGARICLRNLDGMFLHPVAFHMVKVPLMQIVDMADVANGGMAAGRPMLVGVIFVHIC